MAECEEWLAGCLSDWLSGRPNIPLGDALGWWWRRIHTGGRLGIGDGLGSISGDALVWWGFHLRLAHTKKKKKKKNLFDPPQNKTQKNWIFFLPNKFKIKTSTTIFGMYIHHSPFLTTFRIHRNSFLILSPSLPSFLPRSPQLSLRCLSSSYGYAPSILYPIQSNPIQRILPRAY